MKVRNGFVSNSSSQSFLIRGVLLKYETIGVALGINMEQEDMGDAEYTVRKALKNKSINLTTRSNRFYFGGEKTKEMILGMDMDSLDDGVVREITDKEITANDVKIKEELAKINVKPESLSTFIQYISNDNY
jgi:hypothetical protein